MRRIAMFAAALPAALMVMGLPVRAQEMPADYQEALTTLGKKGDYKAHVFKVNIPRSDLKVTVDGVATPTPFGFGGWLAMTKGDKGLDVMMGDLVLLQDEVNPVMSALLENGLEVTALHNHFFWEEPRIFYMHVHGHGKAADLARKVKPAVDLIGHVPARADLTPRPPSLSVPLVPRFTREGGEVARTEADSPFPSANSALSFARAGKGAGGLGVVREVVAQSQIDTARLDQIIGHKGEALAGGVYKFTIGRDDLKLKEMGATINARMGLNTWAAFYGAGDNAAVAGDVAMLEHEVTPVLKALRTNGLDVVAIHHHMTGSRPLIIFLHYWGKGPADRLATGFKAALDELGRGSAGRMAH